MSGSRTLNMPGRRRRRHARGQGMVEFALVAPIALLLIIGIVVVSMVVLHQNQLANATRDIARVAAICGQSGSATPGTTPPTLLPPIPPATTGTTCSDANLLVYAKRQLAGIDSSYAWNPTITVVSCTVAGACTVAGSGLASCANGNAVHVAVTYPQTLYVPVVSNLFGSGGVRTLSATGVASCEQ
jgi:Flp pilus assembly protein TadG